ncbi:MAG: Gfo/Idh/MocA family oxidoreductase [Chloroflexi bacterium]|nr:Gfo/Idh/MocA family oxidoreductase [Chloroflexota bacterium]
MDARVKVGILGCGNIFPQYINGCRAFGLLEVVACADLDLGRARARAEEFSISKACTSEELLADPEIQLVVNLTVPQAHFEINLAAIEAGKNVHAEKPFALKREDGQRILAAAAAKGVRVGCAPDTFLGGGLQTCRKLIDEGWIGQPVAAVAFMAGHGPEAWHPNPDFFYQFGGGPLFDMGPYYITALISLLGPVTRVTSSARISFPERIATSQALFGRRIGVEVPTHVAGVLDFESGVVATLVMSFDVWAHNLPRIEIYGSEGSLSVPDPNTFGGPVRISRAGAGAWSDIPLTHSAEVGRGIGAADMAYGLVYGRPHRASGQLANHVLDVMASLYDASESGAHVMVQSRAERPAPLPLGLLPGTLDG